MSALGRKQSFSDLERLRENYTVDYFEIENCKNSLVTNKLTYKVIPV